MSFTVRVCISTAILSLVCLTVALAGMTPEEVREFQELKIKADKGDAESQCQVGHCYRTGSGVRKDSVEGVKWLRMSAKHGNQLAQCNLGICYQYGDGVEQDYAEAFKLYQMAADQGAACGLVNLAFCHKQGQGTAKNLVEAYALYLTAGADRWAKEVEAEITSDQITSGKKRSKELLEAINVAVAARKAGK